MNTRILIIAAALLLGGGVEALAQTRLIAHRSHSGSDASFAAGEARGADNFGLPMPIIDSVMRVSDTVVIEFTNEGNDTVTNHPVWSNPKISLDSLRRRYPRIKFIGFEKGQQATRAMRPRRRAEAVGLPAGSSRPGAGGWLVIAGVLLVPIVTLAIWKGDRKGSA